LITNPGKLTKSIVQRMIRDGVPLKINHIIGLIDLFGKAGAINHTTGIAADSSDDIRDGSNVDNKLTKEEILEKEFTDPYAITGGMSSMSIDDILNDMHVFIKSVCFNPKLSSSTAAVEESLERSIIQPISFNQEIVTTIIKVYCQCGRIEQAISVTKNTDSLFGVTTTSSAYFPIYYALCRFGKIEEAELLLTEVMKSASGIDSKILDIFVQYERTAMIDVLTGKIYDIV
jgi:hypothetical protein